MIFRHAGSPSPPNGCVFQPSCIYLYSFADVGEEGRVSSEKLQGLGWRYRPLEETLVDSIESYKNLGILN